MITVIHKVLLKLNCRLFQTAAPICPVCHKDIRPGDESVQLKQQRGVDNCNFHAKRRKLDHNFEVIDSFHGSSSIHEIFREALRLRGNGVGEITASIEFKYYSFFSEDQKCTKSVGNNLSTPL